MNATEAWKISKDAKLVLVQKELEAVTSLIRKAANSGYFYVDDVNLHALCQHNYDRLQSLIEILTQGGYSVNLAFMDGVYTISWEYAT